MMEVANIYTIMFFLYDIMFQIGIFIQNLYRRIILINMYGILFRALQ